MFIERALSTLAPDGYFSFIIPSNFMTNNYSVCLRKLLTIDGHLAEIVNFNGRVFSRASVDTCIFLVNRTKVFAEISLINAIPKSNAFEKQSELSISLKNILANSNYLITATSTYDMSVLDSIEFGTIPLGRIASVNFGKQLRDRRHFTGDVIRASTHAHLPHGYARCYTGRDVQRYCVSWSGLLCLTDRSAQTGGCWDDVKQNAEFKILCKQIGKSPTFGIDAFGYQCLNTMFMINVDNVRSIYYILGILNSKMMRFYWLKRFYDHRITFPKVKGTYLKELPIKKFDTSSDLVRCIEKNAEWLSGNIAKVASLNLETERRILEQKLAIAENELDRAVYELYAISKAQINSIEAFLLSQTKARAPVTSAVGSFP